MTISEIRDILKQETVEKTVLEEIMADERKGVRQLVDAYIRRLNRESAERFRVEDMYEPESSFYKKGLEYVAGIDEVGRGPLAGPVTVAAVILKPHFFIAGLNDSKKVAPRRREEIAKKIHETAVDISIVSLSPEEIDMRNMKIQPQAVIVDAMPLHFPVPSLSLVHGDAKSASVAAASIVAKVHRDHLMDEYDKVYPGYGFSQNKGYGTAEHIEAIRTLGITPIHRKSFEPVKSMVNGTYL